MMKTLAILFLLAATSMSAQTVERVIDLSSLGWGALETPVSVETDGDLSTHEWLVRTADDRNGYRVVAEHVDESGDKLCVGPWFHPTRAHLFASVSLQRVGLTHALVIRGLGSPSVTMVRLDTPACQ